jgi:hypothetical protein
VKTYLRIVPSLVFDKDLVPITDLGFTAIAETYHWKKIILRGAFQTSRLVPTETDTTSIYATANQKTF